MEEKIFFLSLVIIGFALGIVGYSAIMDNGVTGNAVYNNVAEYHTRCVEGKCVELAGPGNSECEINEHCYHWGCIGTQCILINTPGANTCTSNSDCY